MIPKPVLIDTDTGVDDALALIVALHSPELSVKAITTVAGNVEVQKCTRNVLLLLELLKVKDRPLVAQGATKPLRQKLVTAPEVHGKDGLGGISFKKSTTRKTSLTAVETILDACNTWGKKLTIVAIGPLTNLAQAWKKDSKSLRKVGRIVSMGGVFRVPGNTGPVAEFNYFVDPDAAHVLFNTGLPITVVPLDLTHQIVLMRREMEYRAKRRASRLTSTILRLTKFYMQYHKKIDGFYGAYVHDPIAVAVAIDPTLVQTQNMHVDVETEGQYTRGMTVADFRKTSRHGEQTVDVALTINRERFLKLFHERLWK
ncbi:MAG: nucleoside hydrolase [Ignavibacteriales bacterium]|nr:nucleoside hydrolase [Ignavibacteriales bacterium]